VCGRLATVACLECLDSIVKTAKPVCLHCLRPIPCMVHGDAAPFLVYGAMHRGLAKRLVHRFKYEGHRALGRQMGKALARNMTVPAVVDVIVPVPLHRKSDRPYNQALELACGMSEIWEIPVANVLQWALEGKRQVEKTARERKELPLNALIFSGSPGALCGKKALVVDDVSTTGTTLKRSVEVLQRNGVKVPGAVVWTRVPDKE